VIIIQLIKRFRFGCPIADAQTRNISLDHAYLLRNEIAGKQLNLEVKDSFTENQPVYCWKYLPSLLSSSNLNRPDKGVLSSGFRAVDEVFNGYLPGGLLIQIGGPECSGKTQFCLYSAVCSAIHGNKVLIIDTSNSIHIHRIRNILLHRVRVVENTPSEKIGQIMDIALSNIHIQRVHNDIFTFLNALSKALDAKIFDLVIVDSLHRLYSPTAEGNGDISLNVSC